jgi:hypothetical protein
VGDELPDGSVVVWNSLSGGNAEEFDKYRFAAAPYAVANKLLKLKEQIGKIEPEEFNLALVPVLAMKQHAEAVLYGFDMPEGTEVILVGGLPLLVEDGLDEAIKMALRLTKDAGELVVPVAVRSVAHKGECYAVKGARSERTYKIMRGVHYSRLADGDYATASGYHGTPEERVELAQKKAAKK